MFFARFLGSATNIFGARCISETLRVKMGSASKNTNMIRHDLEIMICIESKENRVYQKPHFMIHHDLA